MSAANGVVHVFKGQRAGHWWWHKKSANGRLVSSSGESFKTRWGAKRAAKRANPDVPVVVDPIE